jgi:hypothetical protein
MVQQYIDYLLFVMATMEVAPYFRLFLFIAMLNTESSMHNLKRMKFPNFWCKYHIFCDVLHELDGCLECTFSHLITLKNKKDHQI